MAEYTPMMKQYFEIKEKHKDALLFYRLGDFYEMFFDDAIIASKELELALTGRDCGQSERAPMCGVPHHAVNTYIQKLIEKDYKIAICEQVEEPGASPGVVKREVVRIITPGTVIETNILDEKKNNYLVCIFSRKNSFGVSAVDISTGEFSIFEVNADNKYDLLHSRALLLGEMSRYEPKEVIINIKENDNNIQALLNSLIYKYNSHITYMPESSYDTYKTHDNLLSHFKVPGLSQFNCAGMTLAIRAAGALIEYLNHTQKTSLPHINDMKAYSLNEYMVIDDATRTNLELIQTIRGKQKKGSLLHIIDNTTTLMGARMLRRWIQQPLIKKADIEKRYDAIDELLNSPYLMDDIADIFSKIHDLERLIAKVSYQSANPRDMLLIKKSLEELPRLGNLLSSCNNPYFKELYKRFDLLDDVYKLISDGIDENAPISVKDGGIIKPGYDKKLDEYLYISTNGKQWLSEFEAEQREKTGIKNLKIGYNRVFGYYIEVTRSFYDRVPDTYTRKQTLANSERFIIDELKQMETTILEANELSKNLHYKLFVEIREKVAAQIFRLQTVANIVSVVDCIYSLAQAAFNNNYCRPEITNDDSLSILEGRHPVVEQTLAINEYFVPNDTFLDTDNNNLIVITGPNMAGKSTYIRQTALIALMAQIGSFVPAKSAKLGIIDRIFTRVGASDDISSHQSTFMVEMVDVANILNNATAKSLIILDEIGRGTSTFDGLSIAWSVCEHICERIHAKSLFATHYHELTELEGRLDGLVNFCVATEEKDDDVIFLRKIIRGGAQKSYGIHVAKMAGVPDSVIYRAKEILAALEEADITHKSDEEYNPYDISVPHNDYRMDMPESNKTLKLYEVTIIDALRNINMEETTPIKAFEILNNLIEKTNELDGNR